MQTSKCDNSKYDQNYKEAYKLTFIQQPLMLPEETDEHYKATSMQHELHR